MTQYFEIEKRDGAARIGKLLLVPKLRTPCIISTSELGNIENPGAVVDVGSFWGVESDVKLEERVKQIREKTKNGNPMSVQPKQRMGSGYVKMNLQL